MSQLNLPTSVRFAHVVISCACVVYDVSLSHRLVAVTSGVHFRHRFLAFQRLRRLHRDLFSDTFKSLKLHRRPLL